MRIEFSPEFGKYVGFLDYVEITGKRTVGDTIQELFNRFPSLLMFLVDKEYAESKKTSVKLNGEYIFEFADLETEVSDSDILAFGRDVPEGAGGVGKLIAGAVLMVAAVGLALWSGGGSLSWTPWATSLMLSGLGMAVGGIADLIIGQPKLPSFASEGGSDSPSYSFGSIPNTTASGTPVGIVYGRHRIGGHLLNVYTEVKGKSDILHAQLGLCEGPIEQIESPTILINGKDIETYNDVSVYWRRGTKEQLPEGGGRVYSSTLVGSTTGLPDTTVDPISGAPDTSTIVVGASIGVSTPYVIATSTESSGVDLKISSRMTPGSSGPIKVDLVVVFKKSEVGLSPVVTTSYTYTTYTAEPSYNDSAIIHVDAPTGVAIYEITVLVGAQRNAQPADIKLASYKLTNTGRKVLYKVPVGVEPPAPLVTGTTDTGPVMLGFKDIRNSVDLGAPVITQTGTVITTSKPVNSVSLVVSAPAFYYTGNTNETAFAPVTVNYDIYYKKDTESTSNYKLYKAGASAHFVFTDKSKSEVFRENLITFDDLAIYNIKIVRIEARHDTNSGENWRYQDDIYAKSVTEVVNGSFIYPWTTLLGVNIKAGDQLQGSMPTITEVIKGKRIKVPDVLTHNLVSGMRSYSGVWNGTSWKEEWSNDPVWCLWDLLTNSRYGLADYFKIDSNKLPIVLSQLYVLSQHCADEVTYIDGGTPYTQNRYSLDLVIDTSKPAIEWINTICGVMNAFVCYTEGYLYIDIDRVKPMTQIFNMSNIREFKQSGGSYKEIPNCYEVQFADEKDNKYEMDVFRLEASELQTDSSIEERKKTLNLIGVTNIHRCKRIAKKLLLRGQRATTTVSFKTGTHALQSMIGDVVGIQHDVPQWGFDGVVQAYSGLTLTVSEYELFGSKSSYSVIFSQGGRVTNRVGVTKPPLWSLGVNFSYNTVYLHNGKLYKAKSTHTSMADDEPEVGINWETKWRTNYTVQLAGPPTFADDNTPCTPAKGDICVIGETSYEVKPFRVLNIKRDPDEQIELTCVEYVESVYTDSDNLTDLDTAIEHYYTELPIQRKSSVKNFKAESVLYTDSSGSIKNGIDCWYTVPFGDLFWKGVIIKYGITGSGIYEQRPIDNTGYVRIPSIDVEGNYQVIACSVFTDGTQQSPNEALSDYTAAPYDDVTVSFFAENSAFLEGITGLQIAGAAPNATEFTGRSCTFVWNKRQSTDFALDQTAGAGLLGATTNANDSWFGYYKVEILNSNLTVRRTSKIYDEQYTYSHDDNHADGLSRYFTIRVTIYDRLGRDSAPKLLAVSNPVPVTLG